LTEAKQQRLRVNNFDGKQAVGIFRNLTPYPMTFVGKGRFDSDRNTSDWAADFPATLNPGDQFIYRLNPYNDYATTQQYSGWFTYRADTVQHTEYVSMSLDGSHCTGLCLPRDGPPLSVSASNESTPPNYTPYGWVLGTKTANPEIGWTSSGTTSVFPHIFNPDYTADFDYTFETQGTYNIDASKIPSNKSGALADVLNGLCQSTTKPPCAFTPTSPLTFQAGKLSQYTDEPNCSVNTPGQEPLPAAERDVTVTQSRESTLSVGGSATVGVEADVFNVVEVGVSVKFGVEHEWTDDTEFSKTVKIWVPSGWVGVVWIAPEIGTVTGTLVMQTAKASYTFTNLTQTKSGVQPDLLTPAYDLIFDARPMTAADRQQACPAGLKAAPAPVGGRG
jgi:hypothetical protein